MRHNENKAISAGKNGITVFYTDTCKHYNILYERDSILKSLQTEGNKFNNESYQKIGENLTQQKAYRIALYGLSVFTPDELSSLSFLEKNRIVTNQKKVQRLLDKWKQEICHKKIGSFVTKFFKMTDSLKNKDLFKFATYDYYDSNNKNKMDFKDLGINKDMIVQKLMSAGLLPRNYYELT